jgi:hypothetical protein
LAKENLKTRRESCPSGTLSATNPTLTDAGSNPGLRGETPVTNYLSHGTASRTIRKKLVVAQLVNKYPLHVEPEGSLPWLQAHDTWPYPEWDESSSHFPTCFFSYIRQCLPNDLFASRFSTDFVCISEIYAREAWSAYITCFNCNVLWRVQIRSFSLYSLLNSFLPGFEIQQWVSPWSFDFPRLYSNIILYNE